jgi:hypothetical protein
LTVLAFRGTEGVARSVNYLDPENGMEDYRKRLFLGWPGFYDVLPDPARSSGVDIYDQQNWPQDGPLPHIEELQRARDYQQSLYPGDERFFLIAGVGQETIVGAELDGDQFRYLRSLQGDGTVPLSCCLLPAAKTYYVVEAHGALPNNGSVCEAVCDILGTGTTTKLPDHWIPAGHDPGSVTDDDMWKQWVAHAQAKLEDIIISGAASALGTPTLDETILKGFLSLGDRSAGQ